MSFINNRPNYDKFPVVEVKGCENDCYVNWNNITNQLNKAINNINKNRKVVVVECYTGVNDSEVLQALQQGFKYQHFILAQQAMKTASEIEKLTYNDVTDDDIFGYLTRFNMIDFFDADKLKNAQKSIEAIKEGTIVIYGNGASLLAPQFDLLIYADMPRWEGQLRYRRNEVDNLGLNNKTEKASLQYKRAYFVDWRVCDRLKRTLMHKWDYVLDTTISNEPKMATGVAVNKGIKASTIRPFRVVPFFDPGPWGGQWMKEVCDLDPKAPNYAWCFDCVPEENSLLLGFGNIKFEIPSINVVFMYPSELLGKPVHGRFGDEFPIRFDFLDTMDGGNLSLQVHPLTEYIQEKFGMHYTQDESYYMLDTAENACVYLGLKEGVDSDAMINELTEAQTTGVFDAEKHVQKWDVKKHDHVLIPAGTIHCSGNNSMVLEISATPYIFTFKLWDWGRMGMDGKPRPINIKHGKNVIDWSRTTQWTANNLINQVEPIASGDGWKEERTGLHEREFIETRRHWFSKSVLHKTNGSVNVINLIEGREAIVESPTNAFEPYVVHYAETFIIPDAVKEYTIRPYGESEGKTIGTLKAYVRNNY